MATWNEDIPALASTIGADVPDIEENFQELHDVIEAITNGTLGTTEPASFEVDVVADGTAGFASTTVMLFGQTSAPTGWTKKTDWQDNAMLCYASGTPGSGGSVNPQSTHIHTHTHSLPMGVVSAGTAWCFKSTQISGTFISDIGISAALGSVVQTRPALVSDSGGIANTAPYYQEVIAATKD